MTNIKPGSIVLLAALDDIPEHLFLVDDVYEDCIGGYSLTGPLKGEYGEPEYALVIRVISEDGDRQGT